MENPVQLFSTNSVSKRVTSQIVVACIVTSFFTGAVGYILGRNSVKVDQVSQLRVEQVKPQPTISGENPSRCNKEQKMCPDGSSVSREEPSCEFAACPRNEKNQLVIATYIRKLDSQGEVVPNTNLKNFVLTFPKEYVLEDNTGKNATDVVTKGSVNYRVDTGDLTYGLCPMFEDESDCGYTDEKSKNYQLRIWKNNDGVFALNLIGISIDGYYLSKSVITKEGDPGMFSPAEITEWKKILSTLSVVDTP